MTIKELRKLIREAIEDADMDNLTQGGKSLNPKKEDPEGEGGPMFERDDVGQFYAVLHPKGNENINEIVFETNVHGYKDAVGEGQVAAIVKNESRAKAIGDKLLKAKLHELTSGIDNQINSTKTQIKELEAVVGSIRHYYELKEGDPKSADEKTNEYLQELEQHKTRLEELEQQKADIKAGKLPNTTDPNVTKNPVTQNPPLAEGKMTKKQDKVVKGMKKSTPDLKKRYGKDWKNVMYGHAKNVAPKKK